MSDPSDPQDRLNFQQGPVAPDAGIYRTPLQGKSSKSQALPQVSSRILNAPAVQAGYASFGLEGLKSMLLQELVRLEWPQLQDELALLAEGANQHKEIKRGLRATKLLASQWLADPRQPEEIRSKCEFIFNSISTFGTIVVQAPETAASQMDMSVQFPSLGPSEPVGAEAEHELPAGAALLLITDLQGHYARLETMLLNTQLAQIREGVLHWSAPEGIYLVLSGDLFNKSPYSTWGDQVGFETYALIKTLRRFLKIASNRIFLSYGAHDLDLAVKAAFYHPVSGFLGETLGVNAQAQSIPAVISYIQGTGQPESPDFAWDYQADSDSYLLKESYQEQGFPYLVLPARDGAPELSPLLDFYHRLYERLLVPQVEQRPQTIQQIDAVAAGLLPAPSERLNLQNLATSLGRCLHYQGLLKGSGTLEFLREQVAGLHVLKVGDVELFAMHPEVQEITLDMLGELKTRGAEAWEPMPLELFIQNSRVLVKRRIDQKKLLERLHQLKINQLNDWLALSEQHFYRRLVQHRQLSQWVPEIVPKQDEKGFTEAWRQLRWELINEDPTGLAGYAINMDGVSRRGEPLMRKMADLDERTRRSYARTFLLDLFREEVPTEVNVQPEGIVIQHPHAAAPAITISLLIDDTVAIFRDPKESLHMPVKHAAWIETRS